MASDSGFFVADADAQNVRSISPSITSPVDSPDISPDGSLVAFEFQQQIWTMNIDGSSPQRLVQLAGTPVYPTFSPDGTELAYLVDSSSGDDRYERAIYAIRLSDEQTFTLDIDSLLPRDLSRTVIGPMTWIR